MPSTTTTPTAIQMASATPNGNADAAATISSIPPVVGINFGNSYASIAVFTKVGLLFFRDGELTSLGQEGLAESIANEDGERQIACAIAFQGEEMVNDYYPNSSLSSRIAVHRESSQATARQKFCEYHNWIPQPDW